MPACCKWLFLRQVHLSYMKAGAQIITTNSYSTQPNYYNKGESLIRQEVDTDKSLEELIRDHAKLSAILASKAKIQFYQNHPNSQRVQVSYCKPATRQNKSLFFSRRYLAP